MEQSENFPRYQLEIAALLVLGERILLALQGIDKSLDEIASSLRPSVLDGDYRGLDGDYHGNE